MAIFTRFGSEVEIIGVDRMSCELIIQRIDDGAQFNAIELELKADKGLDEIQAAARHFDSDWPFDYRQS